MSANATPKRPSAMATLLRCRALQARNALDQQLRDAPWRLLVIIILLFVIWAALYLLLDTILRQVNRWEWVSIVAHLQIFTHFFLVLAIMLAFSNAILAFSSLYGRSEAGHLLAMPASARQIICVKWLEGMLLSSWSFMLLGVPLMLAVARNAQVDWYYYPLFIGHFAGFILIPSTLGLLAACAVAMYAPRRPLVIAFWGAGLIVAAVGIWLWRLARRAEESDQWLEVLFAQLSIARQPLLPSTWTARGIVAALEGHVETSLFYLGVTAANAAFFAWATVNILGSTWSEAYSRARQGRYRPVIEDGWFTAVCCFLLFFYLPKKMRELMLKDLRGFARDATQWTQMVIMLGLLVIYAVNLKRLPVDLSNPTIRALIAFLNLTTISLILATFTSRFVYPLLSLEGQQLWLIGLLPMRRTTLLVAKFLFALTITGLSAAIVMGLSVYALDLPPAWARLHVAIAMGICVGLCGLSVGLGARFPVFGQRNPARIASGFGGTFNLIASMIFVAIEMLGVAYLGLREFGAEMTMMPVPEAGVWLVPLLLAISVVVALLSLAAGARHFERLEQ